MNDRWTAGATYEDFMGLEAVPGRDRPCAVVRGGPLSRRREALAARMGSSLPREPGGAISLTAGAWVVRGVVR